LWNEPICFCNRMCYENVTNSVITAIFFSYFHKYKSILVRSPCSLCVVYPPCVKFWMPEPNFMKLATYIMAPAPIFINPSHLSVGLYVYPIVARQRLGKDVLAAMKNCWMGVFTENKIWSWVPWDSEPRITVLARTSINLAIRKFVGSVVLYTFRVVSKDSRLLILPWSFFFLHIKSYEKMGANGECYCWR
jgi:hypothetical protein